MYWSSQPNLIKDHAYDHLSPRERLVVDCLGQLVDISFKTNYQSGK